MATATETPGKTSFVIEFLKGTPQGNFKSINEAWTAAGMKDKISKSVIDRTRAKLRLTGNLSAKASPSAKQKPAPQTATASPGKTSFVREFLHDHPDANTREVNEAWTAAGMEGTISRTLVNKTRIKVTGKGLAKTTRAGTKKRSEAQAKRRVSKPTEVAPTPNKTRFVTEFLNENPQGNVAAINEAWNDAGKTGTISAALINKMRSDLGLTGNLRRKLRKGRSSMVVVTRKPTVQPIGRKSAQTTRLITVEEEIDRLIFTVMGIGNLQEVESALREARRAVYRAMSS
jgi:hypothetical protein